MKTIQHPLMVSNGNKPRKGLVKSCLFCKEDFYCTPSRAKKLFCCQNHYIQWENKRAFSFSCIMCKKQVFTQPIQIKLRNRKTCSIKCRGLYQTELAEKRRISNPPTEGVLRRRIRYSKRMDEWRIAVFRRDDWTCQNCKRRNGNGETIILNADHIKPFANYPELRFDLNNGRTLCLECHRKTTTWGRRKKEKELNLSQ